MEAGKRPRVDAWVDQTWIEGRGKDGRKDARKDWEKDGRMVSYEEVYFRRIRKGEEKTITEGRGMDTTRHKEDLESSGEWKHGRKRKDGGRLLG